MAHSRITIYQDKNWFQFSASQKMMHCDKQMMHCVLRCLIIISSVAVVSRLLSNWKIGPVKDFPIFSPLLAFYCQFFVPYCPFYHKPLDVVCIVRVCILPKGVCLPLMHRLCTELGKESTRYILKEYPFCCKFDKKEQPNSLFKSFKNRKL